MARRRAAEKRKVQPDPRFNNETVTKFINCLMWDGKRSVAERMFYQAVGALGGADEQENLQLFLGALENVRPNFEVKSRRVGGATYPVPVHVRPERAQFLGITWLIDSARKRSEKTMGKRLEGELRDAAAKRGGSFQKRENTHKMAEANRAFSHYRW